MRWLPWSGTDSFTAGPALTSVFASSPSRTRAASSPSAPNRDGAKHSRRCSRRSAKTAGARCLRCCGRPPAGCVSGRSQRTSGADSLPHPGEQAVNEAGNRWWPGKQGSHADRRSPVKLWVAVGIAIAVVAIAWLAYPYRESDAAVSPAPAALPQVVVSKPLMREVDSRLGFLGQFSAVEHLELRPQVGGTLTGIYFKDGDIVRKGDLLFTIDARPYEIRLAQANALLETATARLLLAGRELYRAQVLASKSFGTEQNVDQRTAEQRAAQAAVDDAKAQIRDAEFDLEHCCITAP